MTNVLNLEYVFSAPAYLKVIPPSRIRDNKEINKLFGSIMKKGIEKLKKDIYSENLRLHLSILFNAYTEKNFSDILLDYNLHSFERIYSDSGGLQAIIQGISINEKLKKKIYQIQSQSDFAMCFDVIPCETVRIQSSSVVARSISNNKIYHASQAEYCARKTASNIKEQIESFINLQSNTKVLFIVQGNTVNDMVEWFKYGVEELEDWHWDYIGGIALADTCMGNGIRESIDMVVAYHKISQEFGEKYTKNHVHLLGVGTVPRLRPILYLREKGFIRKDCFISFDSSTFSMKYSMGGIKLPNGEKSGTNQHSSRELLEIIVNYFYPILEEFFPSINLIETVDFILTDYLKPTVGSYLNDLSDSDLIILYTLRALSNCWQILRFYENLVNLYKNMEHDFSPIGLLQTVSTIEEFEKWKSTNEHFIHSRRIFRKAKDKTKSTLDYFGL